MLLGHLELFLWLLCLLGSTESRGLATRDDEAEYDEEWPDMSSTRAVQMRAQRDVSLSTLLNRLALFGVDLKPTLFDTQGYTTDSLVSFRSMLNEGAQLVLVDLYYNENTHQWQLCPAGIPITAGNQGIYYDETLGVNCTVNLQLPTFFNRINAFFLDTPNKYSVNVFYLLLRLHSINSDYQNGMTRYEGDTLPLGKQMKNHINNMVTPSYAGASNLPTLEQFLMVDYFRLIPILLENNLSANTSYDILPDSNYLYFNDVNIDVQMEEYDNLECSSQMNLTDYEAQLDNATLILSYDTINNPFTPETFRESIACGKSTILAHQFNPIESISEFLPYSLWSWGPWDLGDTPTLITYNVTETTGANNHGNSGEDEEYRCAVIKLQTQGWTTSKYCSDTHRVACLNKKDETDWKLTQKSYTFYDAAAACSNDDDIPQNFKFTAPSTPLSQAHLLMLMEDDESLDDDQSIWIDLNSLHTTNCWVTGGPKVVCPYENTITIKMFTQMITPTSVIAFILLMVILSLHFVSLPVHQNKNYWKRALDEQSQQEYEGVPS